MFGHLTPKQVPLVEFVGGYLCGERRPLEGSPLAVQRKTNGAIVFDRYRLQQMGPGVFIYRHTGEE